MKRAGSCLLAGTLLLACSVTRSEAPAAEPSVVLPPGLQRVLTDYEERWRERDSAGLAGLFAPDGFVLAPGSLMVRGRASIEKHYRGSGGPLALRAVAFATDGGVGYVIGAYADRPGARDRGKFTLTLERDSAGRWWIFSDMDNGDPRPAPGS